MSKDVEAVWSKLIEFATTAVEGGAQVLQAASVDTAQSVAEVSQAVGPFGVQFLAAFGPAQASHIAGALQQSALHTGIGMATQATNVAFKAADSGA
ncbi:hypothetical protein BKG69_23315 [Mycobacteroides chelonae]|uniref:hypothetical protein n=1 Tax=Mycobacteroides TaxID=670516 RepID=UPI0008AA056B|nr:hypothetical protein [Mycobacteroides chelonae]AYM40725.1 hypothetical protein DYE20_03365 [[Mycobacterium] chelonae subsp. gwanakae]OHT77321.1 hypothetical protein BKG69_23315 [Mycobacteroides chelonae]OHU16301.1 hypothetical protein BKG75_14995 [Mycobacteroides chelonae]GLE55297.1 hypothetical protein NJBCHELONAE_06080 [Mycobacteroides chelonae]